MSKKLLVAGAVVVVLGLSLSAAYLSNANKTTETRQNEENVQTSEPAEKTNNKSPETVEPSEQTNLAAYNNQTLGFSFSYPKEWGTPQEESSGTALNLSFTNSKFQLSAYAKDQEPQGDGQLITISQGFHKQNNRYFSNWADGNTVELSENEAFQVIEAKNTSVLLWKARSGFAGDNKIYANAMANLNNQQFKGIGISQELINLNSGLEELKQLLSSLKVN